LDESPKVSPRALTVKNRRVRQEQNPRTNPTATKGMTEPHQYRGQDNDQDTARTRPTKERTWSTHIAFEHRNQVAVEDIDICIYIYIYTVYGLVLGGDMYISCHSRTEKKG